MERDHHHIGLLLGGFDQGDRTLQIIHRVVNVEGAKSDEGYPLPLGFHHQNFALAAHGLHARRFNVGDGVLKALLKKIHRVVVGHAQHVKPSFFENAGVPGRGAKGKGVGATGVLGAVGHFGEGALKIPKGDVGLAQVESGQESAQMTGRSRARVDHSPTVTPKGCLTSPRESTILTVWQPRVSPGLQRAGALEYGRQFNDSS